MAKTDNLQDYLTDLANAIREKKGTTELINPQDFSTEIRGISGGGNLEGDNQIIYLNIKAYIDYVIEQVGEDMLPLMVASLPGCVALSAPGNERMGRFIAPHRYVGDQYLKDIDRCAMVTDFRGLIEGTSDVNTADLLPQMLQIGCFEITKEQFYDLTTEI